MSKNWDVVRRLLLVYTWDGYILFWRVHWACFLDLFFTCLFWVPQERAITVGKLPSYWRIKHPCGAKAPYNRLINLLHTRVLHPTFKNYSWQFNCINSMHIVVIIWVLIWFWLNRMHLNMYSISSTNGMWRMMLYIIFIQIWKFYLAFTPQGLWFDLVPLFPCFRSGKALHTNPVLHLLSQSM
jgi:hypothetical protein